MKIERAILEDMIEHARGRLPEECCGLLAGSRDHISRIFRCRNVKASAREFAVDPEELFEIMRSMRKEERELTGIYHSHPTSDAVPSNKDIDEFFYGDTSYWIVSLKESDPVVRCFEWQQTRFRERRFQVVEAYEPK